MKLTSHYAVIRSSSKAVIAIISILSIFLSMFQPVTAAQAAAPIDQKAGLGKDNISLDKSSVGALKANTSLILAPTGPDAPDWPPVFTKKFNPNPIYVGEISTLTFTIVNEVWMDLTGAAFTDPLPAGVQVAADPAASSTCLDVEFNPTPGATVLTFFGTLPGRGTCTIQVNVTSSVPGEHFNITSELTTETGLVGAPASDTLIVLARKTDLAVTKTDGVDEVPAGGVTTYTVRVTNNGPATVTGATLEDAAGPGLEPTAVVCSTAVGNQCVSAPVLADLIGAGISLPTLTPGQFYEILLTVNITATSGTVTNTATVMPPKEIIDTNLDNNVATDTNKIITTSKADLEVTKTNGVDLVNAGGETTYTVRVTNNGPATVSGAILIDSAGVGLMPTAVVCSTAAGNQCVSAPVLADLIGTGISLPTLTPGQFYEILLTVNITATSGTVTNTATVLPPKEPIDPNLENNVASDTDTIVGDLVADLEVTKTDGVDIILTGEITTYTIRVTNKGPATVIGANLYDTADSGLTLLDAVCSTVALNTCVTKPDLALMMTDGITLPTLAPGQFYEIKLIARAADFSCITTNSAIVTPPENIPDPDLSNNTAEDTNEVIPPPQANLAVTKDDGVIFVAPNSVTTYAIRVTNIGPDPVTGAKLIDSAGIGLSLTGVTCSTAVGNQCITPPLLNDLTSTGATLPLLTAGQFYEILLSAKVTATSGTVTNIAIITPPPGIVDSYPNDNSASDTNTITNMLYRLWFPVIQSTPKESAESWNGMLGYEDLSLITGQNDFDYNDWAVAIDGNFLFTLEPSTMLKSFTLGFDPRTRGGTYDHSFLIRFPAQTFTTNGTVVINVYDENQNLISQKTETFSSNIENTYVIFAKTSEVFPGSIVNTIEGNPTLPAQRFAELSITFDTPTQFDYDPNALFQPHGQNLFFDPILLVLNISEYIHQGDVRLLSIPFSDYQWPEEGVRIDRAYPNVSYLPLIPPDFTFPASWWTVYNHCVFDGVPCGTP